MRRTLPGVLVMLLVAGCSSGTTSAPPASTTQPTAAVTRSSPPAIATASPPVASVVPSAEVSAAAPSPTPLTYEIAKGDPADPEALRRMMGVTLAELLAANPTVDWTTLRPGDTIVVPPGGHLPRP